MDAKRALKDIQAGRPAPVYLCYGPEKYKMREFIQVLTDLLIEPEHKEFAVSKFDLSEISLICGAGGCGDPSLYGSEEAGHREECVVFHRGEGKFED